MSQVKNNIYLHSKAEEKKAGSMDIFLCLEKSFLGSQIHLGPR